MPTSLVYKPGHGGDPIDLVGGGVKFGTAEALRGHSWSYELGRRGLAAVDRVAREVETDVVFFSPEEADALRRAAARDMAEKTPGSIVAQDGWSQRCFITASEASGVVLGFHKETLTVVLLDGVWRRLSEAQQFIPVEAESETYLDLPYDVPYDLKQLGVSTELQGPEWMPAPIRLIVYGHAVNPEVTIGGNVYAVDCTVPAGGYLVIDGAEMDPARKVYTVGPDGSVTNRFADARRGDGEGSGEYIFEKVKPGAQPVDWDLGFGFDVSYYEEEMVPPWTKFSS